MMWNHSISFDSDVKLENIRHKVENNIEITQREIMDLPQDVIEVIGTEIFDITSIDELKKYF